MRRSSSKAGAMTSISTFNALFVAAAAAIVTPSAHAQDAARTFDIPSQALGPALNAWSEQARVQVLYTGEAVAGRTAPAVRGQMAPREALARLIAGSGLTITRDDGRVVALQAADREAASELGEIIVTAQRREQAATEVPFALTALTGDVLRERGVSTLRDLSLYTPGLVVEDQSPNNPIFVMRGINSSGGDSFSEPRVSVFQDGVPISKSRGSFVELFDIARVEVAKGPQSTLFGRGALIGGINVIQNHARPDLDWSASVEGGNQGQAMVEGMVNLPVNDVLAVRLSGRHRERDGSLENLAPDSGDGLNALRLDAVRASVAFKPTDRFSADLIFNFQQEETDGTGFKSMYLSPTDPETGRVLAGTATNDPVWLSVPADFAGGRGLGVDQQYAGVTGLMRYHLTDALTLNAVSGYRDVDSIEVYDADGTSLPVFTTMEDNGGRFFNQELRLNYDGGGRLSGFVGANYYRERARSQVDVRFDERILLAQVSGMLNGGPFTGLPANNPAPLGLFVNTAFTGALVQGVVAQSSGGNILLSGAEAAALAARLDPAHVETSNNTADLDSIDLFADATFRATDRWEISAGLRYTSDDKTTRWGSSVAGRSILGGIVGASGLAATGNPVGVATGRALLQGLTAYGTNLSVTALPAFGINAQPTAGNGGVESGDLDDDGFTWRLTSRYDLTGATNLYGSYSRGRRAAVLSAAAPSGPGAPAQFTISPAETVDAFEIGLKTYLREQRARFDASVYYYDYENFQTRELVGSGFITSNAGEARAYGVELQGDWQATDALSLFGTYAYSHARFGSGAYEGNRFARSPDHSLSVGASLKVAAPGGTLDIRPSYAWRSKIFFSDDNDRPELQTGRIVADLLQDEYQDAYGLLNLRIAYTPDAANWEVEAFASNLADEVYRKGAGSAGESIGMPTNVLGEPRLYGVRLTFRR
ncbi:MAG: TonB-dependent receptor [Brevundimonas sp.]|nr:MAG: TonB-dependent receptor [Brevundimonas sp.]